MFAQGQMAGPLVSAPENILLRAQCLVLRDSIVPFHLRLLFACLLLRRCCPYHLSLSPLEYYSWWKSGGGYYGRCNRQYPARKGSRRGLRIRRMWIRFVRLRCRRCALGKRSGLFLFELGLGVGRKGGSGGHR